MHKKEDILKLVKKHKINQNIVNIEELIKGVNIEKEHHCSLNKCFQVALDHVKEYPDYYKRLIKMEKQAEKYWKNKNRNIFI